MLPSTEGNMELTDREHTVVTNIWGDDTPADLGDVDTALLVDMHRQVAEAVQLSYKDDDVDSLDILLPLESKITRTLHSRL